MYFLLYLLFVGSITIFLMRESYKMTKDLSEQDLIDLV